MLASSLVFSQSKLKDFGLVAKIDTMQYVQLTGIVINDSLERIPYAKVKDLSTNRGTLADFYGYYALVVHPGDTVEFSSLGYKTKRYVISDTMSIRSFTLVQVMAHDTITIDPVDIYPWPSREEFADYFLSLDIPDDDLTRAQQRLSPQEMAFVGALVSADGGSSYSAYRAQMSQALYTRGQMPQNNLLNPASWAEFLKNVGTGKYKISQ